MARKTKNKHGFKQDYLIISGLLLISIFLVWRYHQARILSFNTKSVAEYKSLGVKPIYIKSYPVGVDIKVGEATIKDGVWAILPNSASYLLGSAGIGDNGNIIIYGHNKDNILGPIRWMQVGQKIEIDATDDKKYIYEVIKTDVVDPNNLEYIKPKDVETLTIYTCTGFFDSKRFIVVAKRVS